MKPNHQRFGFKQTEWEIFKVEAREILIGVAKQRGMITYGELAGRMTTIQVEPHDTVLWEIIGDVSRDEEKAGRSMLVERSGTCPAGPGSGLQRARNQRAKLVRVENGNPARPMKCGPWRR